MSTNQSRELWRLANLLAALPAEVRKPVQEWLAYVEKVEAGQGPTDLAEAEQQATDLADRIMRAALAARFAKTPMSPEMRAGVDDMVRNFSQRKKRRID